jgi:DNA topoisomerase IA
LLPLSLLPLLLRPLWLLPRLPLQVLASYGHIRDLAQRPGSVAPDDGFAMTWSLGKGAGERVRGIKAALRGAQRLILATDPDREGEAISWHLAQELQVAFLAWCNSAGVGGAAEKP